MPSKKEFRLIGMQHTRSNIQRLLAVAEKTFSKRDKIGFELPRDDVNAIKLLYQMLRERKHTIPKNDLSRNLSSKNREMLEGFAKAISNAVNNKEIQRIPKRERRAFLRQQFDAAANYLAKRDFSYAMVFGLLDRGFEPIGIDSRHAQDVLEKSRTRDIIKRASGSFPMSLALASGLHPAFGVAAGIALVVVPTKRSVVLAPLRDKFMGSSILKEKNLSGAFVGSIHMEPVRRILESKGTPVKKTLVEGRAGVAAYPIGRMVSLAAHARYKNRKRKRRKLK
ncbi:MAG: hypothetical protein JW772_04675 [Candidatus Diapherotrites archaeon]|nr:hypothetical protein [Candidatus Diapherotrites archaeon]